MPPRKQQKPNELCACGSAHKFKKCCGAPLAAAAAAAAVPPAPPPDASTGESSAPDIMRLYDEAVAASEAVPQQWGRLLRRCTALLALLSDEVLSAHTPQGSCPAAATFLDLALCCLKNCTNAHAQPGRPALVKAEDCRARALAILLPPHSFYARGVLCLTHAAWRDTPLDASDARITVAPEAVAPLVLKHLSAAHGALARGYTRCHTRPAAAIAAYEAANAALRAEPRSAKRHLRESSNWECQGHSHALAGRKDAAQACYDAAMRVLMNASELEPVARAAAVQKLRDSLENDALAHSDEPFDQTEYAANAAQWPHGLTGVAPAMSEVCVCCTMVQRTATEAKQRLWLLRATQLQHAPAAHRAAALLACRGCGAPAVGGAKWKLCSGCERVAYCGAACQRADWRRRKRWCTGAHAGSAEAALADATCCVCRRAVVCDDAADEGEGLAGAAAPYQRVALLRCMHLAHAACLSEHESGCPVCTS